MIWTNSTLENKGMLISKRGFERGEKHQDMGMGSTKQASFIYQVSKIAPIFQNCTKLSHVIMWSNSQS